MEPPTNDEEEELQTLEKEQEPTASRQSASCSKKRAYSEICASTSSGGLARVNFHPPRAHPFGLLSIPPMLSTNFVTNDMFSTVCHKVDELEQSIEEFHKFLQKQEVYPYFNGLLSQFYQLSKEVKTRMQDIETLYSFLVSFLFCFVLFFEIKLHERIISLNAFLFFHFLTFTSPPKNKPFHHLGWPPAIGIKDICRLLQCVAARVVPLHLVIPQLE